MYTVGAELDPGLSVMFAHVMLVVCYLGFAEHASRPFCFVKDWTQYLKDIKSFPEPETVDDSDHCI
jgi:hypothetical protein